MKDKEMATATKDHGSNAEATVHSPTPNKIESASKIISSATRWSAATGLIPLPFVDLAALAAVQAKMVIDLSHLYEQKTSEEAVRGTISVLLGTLLSGGLASYTTSAVARSVPAVGLAVGVVSFGGFAAAATFAIGKVFVAHYEGGGTFHSFSPEAVSERLRRDVATAKA
ncbi:DUF697 domain-containing protein [Sphingomonas pokkalii]|nr:DUF697 domain-containing protein [Sphingomonas pokkalii]